MESKRLRITKKHVTSSISNEQIIYKSLPVSDPVQIKIYLVEFSTKFFYGLIDNIRHGYDGDFASRIYLVFINHVHAFIKQNNMANYNSSSLSLQVVLSPHNFQKYLKFIATNSDLLKTNKKINLKLTFVNPDWQQVDRCG